MDGQPLPLEHGYPLRSLALGWTGANCVKWLKKNQTLNAGMVQIRGVAYAGEAGIKKVDVSMDNGKTWRPARFIGPEHPYGWRHWELAWEAGNGDHTILACATDTNGLSQPDTANWNILGYGNNGVREHAVDVHVEIRT